MRKSAKIITALSGAGLAVAAGSAFTATSTIDDDTQYVGAAAQAITGVSVKTVNYTVNSSDVTTAVSFRVTEVLNLTGQDIVKATISNGAAGLDERTDTDLSCDLATSAHVDGGTDVSCIFTGVAVANVKSLSIVAS